MPSDQPAPPSPAAPSRAKTVQEYIDETPCWPDGTQAPASPMTRMQWRIWWLATAGKFFEGLVVFMTGVALPLMVREFGLSAAEKGLVGSAPLLGILVGATALGGLADRLGRKAMFIAEMFLFTLCLAFLVFSPGFPWVLTFLFGMGLALGCDYPTAHVMISESIPTNDRGRLVLGAFGFQAVGALVGTLVGYLILYKNPSLGAWRWMYGSAVIPALAVSLGRFFVTQSPQWLVCQGRLPEAMRATRRLLHREPPYPKEINLAPVQGGKSNGLGYGELFANKTRRATLLASLPWFLQDLSTYGIGIFTPTILATAIGASPLHERNVADIVHNDILAAKGAALIDVLLIVGILGAVLLADRLGRIRLQVMGFIGCGLGLFLAAHATSGAGPAHMGFLFAGFMLFSLMTNLGPNSMTYLIAGEVFPTRMRAKGAGLAASFAKIGAVLTAFWFPIVLGDLGAPVLLTVLGATSLAGAGLTWFLRIETAGMNLETMQEQKEQSPS
ncbi:MAG: MFS transporter [Desulfarculaceae bacterium]|nr:MFS transporter [Desulfarculaceae bacterium]MCF8073546.1 MFS transporter [Desulfarculaceae bacterium]MCF8103068.1 MFS transporter [Desulfarculaceae bacterium]MCF8115738.1 MFS transporter [Desulfarculaceae bacterium]